MNIGDGLEEGEIKALHTVADGYIKNRLGFDLIQKELSGYEKQMVSLENEILRQQQYIEQLEGAREEDREIREQML